ncbi:MAG: N-acetylmuramoyl-L-alanine amidase [Pseudobdellovibrio sp.]
MAVNFRYLQSISFGNRTLAKRLRPAPCPTPPPTEIPVDFLVLHYKACDLTRTLEIFKDTERQVSAHFVLDIDGTIYDLGNFLNGPILRAAHSGKSHLEVGAVKYVNFNQFSIGIEIINLNGNLLKYSEGQYIAHYRGNADGDIAWLKNQGEVENWSKLSFDLEKRIT